MILLSLDEMELSSVADPDLSVDEEEHDQEVREYGPERPDVRFPMAEAALSRVLQWSPNDGIERPFPTPEEFRLACRSLASMRNSRRSQCRKWIANGLDLNARTLRRLETGETPIQTSHVLSLQALIFRFWVSMEGQEPKDIFKSECRAKMLRALRTLYHEPEPVVEVVPVEVAPAAPNKWESMDHEEAWEGLCNELVESGATMTDEEFDRASKLLQSLSNKICMKYIREEKGPKGKHYIDHAVRIVGDILQSRNA